MCQNTSCKFDINMEKRACKLTIYQNFEHRPLEVFIFLAIFPVCLCYVLSLFFIKNYMCMSNLQFEVFTLLQKNALCPVILEQ